MVFWSVLCLLLACLLVFVCLSLGLLVVLLVGYSDKSTVLYMVATVAVRSQLSLGSVRPMLFTSRSHRCFYGGCLLGPRRSSLERTPYFKTSSNIQLLSMGTIFVPELMLQPSVLVSDRGMEKNYSYFNFHQEVLTAWSFCIQLPFSK